jgi:hypothetical protein
VRTYINWYTDIAAVYI